MEHTAQTKLGNSPTMFCLSFDCCCCCCCWVIVWTLFENHKFWPNELQVQLDSSLLTFAHEFSEYVAKKLIEPQAGIFAVPKSLFDSKTYAYSLFLILNNKFEHIRFLFFLYYTSKMYVVWAKINLL